MKTRASSGRVFWGLVFVALGTLLLLDQLDVADTADTVGTWWPMIIVTLGGWRLAVAGGRNLGALIVLLVGVTLQIDQLDVLGRSVWELAWPVALIVLGLWLLLRRPWARDGWPSDSARTSSDDDLDVLSLMSGNNQHITSRAWRGGEVTAIMGGAEIHLDDALPVEDGALLQATAIMGAVEIFVPPGWDVDVHATPLLGSVEDKRRHVTTTGDAHPPRLRLDATAIMGGVELKDA